MGPTRLSTPVVVRSFLLLALLAGACAKAGISEGGGDSDASAAGGTGGKATGGTGGTVGGVDASSPVDVPLPPTCVGLQCQQLPCAGGAPTSLSGTVFAPNGKLPLYNVNVYIPTTALDPLKDGITCDRCGVIASGHPLVTGITDAEGKFSLKNVPAGKDIPLVMQVGKWRRKVTIPNVTGCMDNALSDPEMMRLPRNRQEGDMPKIAVTTGSCDQLGCLLPKIGVDPMELGASGDDKAVTYFADGNSSLGGVVFGPPNMKLNTELWDSLPELSKYDVTLLSCQCSEALRDKTPAAFDAVTKYLNMGGRIFGSHYSYVWLRDTNDPKFAAATTIMGDGAGLARGPMSIDVSFTKGKALADWMKFVDPMVTYGEIQADQIFNDITAAMSPAAQIWATSPTVAGFSSDAAIGPHPRIITANTPVGVPADQQCGRAAHLDAHITGTPTFIPSQGNKKFPDICGKDLTKGEEALAFLFFDLSACIQQDMPIP